MTQHTNFSTRLDDLQQRVVTARSAVQAAAAESDAQLRQRIDRAQADLDQSVENARQEDLAGRRQRSGEVGAAEG